MSKIIKKNIAIALFSFAIFSILTSNVQAVGKDYLYGRDGGDGYDGNSLTKGNFSDDVSIKKDAYAQKFYIEAKPGDEIDLPFIFNIGGTFEAINVEGRYLIDENLFEIVSGCEGFNVEKIDPSNTFDINCKVRVKDDIPSDIFESEIIQINSYDKKYGDRYIYKSSYKNIFIRFPENEQNKKYFNVEGCVDINDNFERNPLENNFSEKQFSVANIFLFTMIAVIIIFLAIVIVLIYFKKVTKKAGFGIVGIVVLILVYLSFVGFKNFREKEVEINKIQIEVVRKESFNDKLTQIKDQYNASLESAYINEMAEQISMREDIELDLGDYVGLIDTTGNNYFEYPKSWDIYKHGSLSGLMSGKTLRAPYADGRNDPGILSVSIDLDTMNGDIVVMDDYIQESKLTFGSKGCEMGDEKKLNFNGYNAVKYECTVEKEYTMYYELARKKDTDSKSKIKYTMIVFQAAKNKIVKVQIEEQGNCGDVYRKQIDDILDSFIILDVSYDKSINNKQDEQK